MNKAETTAPEDVVVIPRPATAIREYLNAAWEAWRGTRSALEAMGIKLKGPWPGELGGKQWSVAQDCRGYKTILTLVAPGMFAARIDIGLGPLYVATRAERNAAREAKASIARKAPRETTRPQWKWTADGRRQRGYLGAQEGGADHNGTPPSPVCTSRGR